VHGHDQINRGGNAAANAMQMHDGGARERITARYPMLRAWSVNYAHAHLKSRSRHAGMSSRPTATPPESPESSASAHHCKEHATNTQRCKEHALNAQRTFTNALCVKHLPRARLPAATQLDAYLPNQDSNTHAQRRHLHNTWRPLRDRCVTTVSQGCQFVSPDRISAHLSESFAKAA